VRLISQLPLNQLFYLINFSPSYLVISYLCGLSTISFAQLSFFWIFFISSTSILQMANTRNRAANTNANNNGENNNNDANPPLCRLPTLEQVLAIQAQMLQTIQQAMVNMQNVQPQAPPLPPRDRFGDFQHTKLPTFSHFMEPMNADDWLKSVEKKMQVVQCNNHEKVLLATHQLSGHVAD
jgi:hypothetical protein